MTADKNEERSILVKILVGETIFFWKRDEIDFPLQVRSVATACESACKCLQPRIQTQARVSTRIPEKSEGRSSLGQ